KNITFFNCFDDVRDAVQFDKNQCICRRVTGHVRLVRPVPPNGNRCDHEKKAGENEKQSKQFHSCGILSSQDIFIKLRASTAAMVFRIAEASCRVLLSANRKRTTSVQRIPMTYRQLSAQAFAERDYESFLVELERSLTDGRTDPNLVVQETLA